MQFPVKTFTWRPVAVGWLIFNLQIQHQKLHNTLKALRRHYTHSVSNQAHLRVLAVYCWFSMLLLFLFRFNWRWCRVIHFNWTLFFVTAKQQKPYALVTIITSLWLTNWNCFFFAQLEQKLLAVFRQRANKKYHNSSHTLSYAIVCVWPCQSTCWRVFLFSVGLCNANRKTREKTWRFYKCTRKKEWQRPALSPIVTNNCQFSHLKIKSIRAISQEKNSLLSKSLQMRSVQ